MSKYTTFADAADDHNPFQDPSVTQHSSNTGYATLDLYNPFDNNTTAPPPPYEATSPSVPPAQTPPSKTTPTEPKNYGSYGTQSAVNDHTADLLKKQEELERKAKELERRERELNAHALGSGASRQNNWPPLPSFCPVGPCFYQDINVEITQSFQRTVTTMYYYWMFTACTLLFNLISSLAMFCTDPNNGVGFGLAILWFILFTPCSFVCWYRPVYKAFRYVPLWSLAEDPLQWMGVIHVTPVHQCLDAHSDSTHSLQRIYWSDSSFNFFAFFFVFFSQLVLYVMMTIGIPGWGFSGWIVSLASLSKNKAVGAIMMINAVLFTAQAAMGVVLLKRVHSMYRQTGASFEKAQAEFTTGVLSNQAVRQAATNATVSAAQGAFTAPR